MRNLNAAGVGDQRLELLLLGPQGGDDLVDLSQLGQGHGAVELGHAEVEAQDVAAADLDAGAVRLVPLVVVSERPLVQIVVVGDDHAAVAAGDGLEDVQREAAHPADGAQLAAVVRSAGGLAGVFQHQQPALLGDRHDGVHVAGIAQHVDRHDGLGLAA